MSNRAFPGLLAVGSLVALGILAGLLYWRSRSETPGPTGRPLIVFAAAAVRPPLEVIADEYERETGQKVLRRFGASEDMLTQAAASNSVEPADVFLPADDSYIELARQRGLIAETLRVARMRAVVLVASGNPKAISSWPDLLRDGVVVAVPNPAAAAGKLTRDHLAKTGRWDALRPRAVDTGTVTEAANAAKLGSAHAAIVWDAVAAQPAYTGQSVLKPPELDGVNATVRIATLSQSRDAEAALRFARYVTAPDHGLREFRTRGFDAIEARGAK